MILRENPWEYWQPNLQGERYPCGTDENQIDWVSSETSLKLQVASIADQYNGHNLLIGCSFGGLAAWLFAAESCPVDLKGVVLIDVLPTLDVFPKRKRVVFSVLQRLPTRISQSIYNQYRNHQKQSPVQVRDVLLRIRSFLKYFPEHSFPIPTLVVSTNTDFHDVWTEIALNHQLLTVQEQTTLSVQVSSGLERWI